MKKALKRFLTEYLFLNLFIFGCVSLLSLVVLNFSFFDPFTEAFKDFSLTDLYYSKIKDRNQIYKGPVVLVNIENKDRVQLAYLLQQIQTGNPKAVGLDIVFSQRLNQHDSLLKKEFAAHSNYVFSYIADFENEKETVYNNNFFTAKRDGYANMIGEHIEYSTIRDYYPFYNGREALTSAIIKQYDSTLYKKLLNRKNKKTEIHYNGNLSNFAYYDFDEVTNPDFGVVLLSFFQLFKKIIDFISCNDGTATQLGSL